jgi:transcriptional regulator with XRE-family HTH domain
MRERRQDARMTQQEFGDRFGLNQGNVSALERGLYAPSADVMGLICEALSIEGEAIRQALVLDSMRLARLDEQYGPPQDEPSTLHRASTGGTYEEKARFNASAQAAHREGVEMKERLLRHYGQPSDDA